MKALYYYVATMDTDSRSWVALGSSEKSAKVALLRAYNQNQKALEEWGYKVAEPFKTVDDLEEYYGVRTWYLGVGEAKSI